MAMMVRTEPIPMRTPCAKPRRYAGISVALGGCALVSLAACGIAAGVDQAKPEVQAAPSNVTADETLDGVPRAAGAPTVLAPSGQVGPDAEPTQPGPEDLDSGTSAALAPPQADGAASLETDAAGLAGGSSPPDAETTPNDGGPRTQPTGDAGKAMRVVGAELQDGCGERVVLRGVNHPTLYVDRPGDALPEIARTGANAVRLFWKANDAVAITEAEPAIARSVAHGMLPILAMHDSTCAWNLESIVRYWTSREAVALITRHEAHLLINLAAQASAPTAAAFRAGYASAISRIRSAGIHVPIIIDASSCARDYAGLIAEGPALLADDPDHNLLFSTHFFSALSAAQVTAGLEAMAKSGLPFIVGAFAHKSVPGCATDLPYTRILADAQRLGIGWLAWSWGDDDPLKHWNTDCPEHDMTSTFSFDSMVDWARVVATTDANGIAKTSARPHALTAGTCR
jgi:mannan endo-1,4-beta-mannosidase